MDKYGVAVDEEHEKTAEEGDRRRCPDCGLDLVKISSANVPICRRCGTEPFERRKS